MCNWSQVKYEYGRKDTKEEIAMNMLKESFSLQMIEKMTGVSFEELVELKKQLDLIPA